MEPPKWAGLTNIKTACLSIEQILMDHSLQTFFPMFEKRGGAWYAWLFLQGIQEEADRFVTSKSKIVNSTMMSLFK